MSYPQQPQQQGYPPQQYQQQQQQYPPQQQGYPQQQQQQQGYPPQQYQQPQQVIIVQQGRGTPWHSDCSDLCAGPGGAGLCCYVFLCTQCAAGDVAVAADRSYIMACCVAPTLSHILQHLSGSDAASLIENCAWTRDRHYLALKYGIADPMEERCLFTSKALLYFQCGCAHCMILQELNHIRAVEMGLAPGPGGARVTVVAPKQMGM